MLGHFIATEFAFCLYQKMFLCISVVRLRGGKQVENSSSFSTSHLKFKYKISSLFSFSVTSLTFLKSYFQIISTNSQVGLYFVPCQQYVKAT